MQTRQTLFTKIVVALPTLILNAGTNTGCGGNDWCFELRGQNITDYEIDFDRITEDGIHVDTSGEPINLVLLDALTREVETCVSEARDEPLILDRTCIEVKIAPNWFYLPCRGPRSTHQAFPCDLSPDWCAATFKDRQENCENTSRFRVDQCYCAGTIQLSEHGQVIVVTPDFAAYKHELLHLVLNEYGHQMNPSWKCQ